MSCFSIGLLGKLNFEIFWAAQMLYENSEQMMKTNKSDILRPFFHAMRVATIFRKGQIHLRKLLFI